MPSIAKIRGLALDSVSLGYIILPDLSVESGGQPIGPSLLELGEELGKSPAGLIRNRGGFVELGGSHGDNV
jgi:hypothetical protein